MSSSQAEASLAPAEPDHPGDPAALALLQGLCTRPHDHVLVLGTGSIELVCGLIRAGSRAVIELRGDTRPDAGSADLVLVPQLRSREQAARAIAHAWRALGPGGRVVVRAPAALAGFMAKALRLHGFTDLQRRDGGFGPVLAATLAVQRHPGRASL